MHCDTIKLMINDWLDNTISEKKAVILKDHLAKCESCRIEFKRLEKADTLLREAVRDMVSRIEAPPGLNGRIERALAAEVMRKPWAGRVSAILKTPAVAAALLLAVITAGVLGLHNPFGSDGKRTDVVMQEPGNITQGESPALQEQLEKPSAPSGNANGPVIIHDNPKTTSAPPTPPAPADQTALPAQVPPVVEKGRLSQEKRLSSSDSDFSVSSSPALKSGTLDEAAREVGFSPSQPSYLPRNTELQDVSWQTGVVYQSYRTGQFYFKIVQGRSDIMSFNYEEELRQGGSPVEINGIHAVFSQTVPEGDRISKPQTLVRWAKGQWTFAVAGELPGEEIIKIASSLR